MRLFAGSNGTVAVAVTNTEYVGVASASTVLVALLPAGDRQVPVASVWQIDITSGKTTDGRGVAVMVSARQLKGNDDLGCLSQKQFVPDLHTVL